MLAKNVFFHCGPTFALVSAVDALELRFFSAFESDMTIETLSIFVAAITGAARVRLELKIIFADANVGTCKRNTTLQCVCPDSNTETTYMG